MARRSPVALAVLSISALALFSVFVALGTWQVHRRTWKLDLIARVEQRVHTPPVAAPGPAEWPTITAAGSEYQHVYASGTFLSDSTTLVQAVTDLGAGYWVLTPLQTAGNQIILINRGFTPLESRANEGPTGAVKITGLMRMTEPGGGFLRKNDPKNNRWYSRDVQAIAAARGLSNVAPYFIDSEEKGDGNAPVGGLTVVQFHNSHLVYVITWYTLALMVIFGWWIAVREGRS
jgi:surfeit locus 1 family protein